MTFLDWIPSLSTASLIGLAAWLFKKMIAERLTYSVKNEFEEKIEEFKSDLKSKETQIQSLRDGALSGLIGRQNILYEKQLAAIDQLWNAKMELSKASGIVESISIFKFEETAREAVKNPKTRQVFETIGGDISLTSLKIDSAARARPYITQLGWAYYSAYQSIILHGLTKLEMLKKGIESPEKYFDFASIDKVIAAVLPHKIDAIKKNGERMYSNCLEEIESLLLNELRNIQFGKESDKENIENVAEIIRATEQLMAKPDSD